MTRATPSDDGAVPSGANSSGSTADRRSGDAPGWGPGVVVLTLVIFTLVIFVFLTVWTAIGTGTGTEEWTRRVLILGPVGVLAATALGWYFGSAVQNERVAQAEAQALQAARDVENGRALAALVLAREGRVVENDAGSTLVDTKATDDQKLRREYADAARLLFPYSLGRTKPTDEFNAHDLNAVTTIGQGGAKPSSFSKIVPPDGKINVPYNYQIIADGSPAPTYWVVNGGLPVGLTLYTDGTLQGRPTTQGSSTFAVAATNSAGLLRSPDITVTIAAA